MTAMCSTKKTLSRLPNKSTILNYCFRCLVTGKMRGLTAYSAAGDLFATVSQDNRLKIWETVRRTQN